MKETCPCPRCGRESELESFDEVDVGVGSISGNFIWCCPNCERWAIDDHVETRHRIGWRVHAFWMIDLEAKLFFPIGYRSPHLVTS